MFSCKSPRCDLHLTLAPLDMKLRGAERGKHRCRTGRVILATSDASVQAGPNGSDLGSDRGLDPRRDRLVIAASSLGTIFEWYDFFLYGILASLLGRLFFTTGNPTTELLFSLFAFGIGFFSDRSAP